MHPFLLDLQQLLLPDYWFHIFCSPFDISRCSSSSSIMLRLSSISILVTISIKIWKITSRHKRFYWLSFLVSSVYSLVQLLTACGVHESSIYLSLQFVVSLAVVHFLVCPPSQPAAHVCAQTHYGQGSGGQWMCNMEIALLCSVLELGKEAIVW